MTSANPKEIFQVTWLIRKAYRLMGVRVDQYLDDLNISACDRSVMDYLYPDHKLSVPQIAELYDVSRQHIQSIVNSLLEREIVQLLENPKHKRSPLVSLSSSGLTLYQEIRKRDERAFTRVFSGICHSDNQVTQKSLEILVENLTSEIKLNQQKEK